MDGRRFISSIFASKKAQCITQVVMNLPNDAAEYLGICIHFVPLELHFTLDVLKMMFQ